jgi:hypothetical protein
MKNSTRFFISFALVFAFVFNGLPGVKGCGPFSILPLFSLKQHADLPVLDYTKGKTGIVPESFSRMSLFVFYRQLNNLPLTNEEQKQVSEAMDNQIYYRSGRFVPLYDYETNLKPNPNYYDEWADARAKITGEKRDIEVEKQISNGYNYFTNCLPDAFHNATKTLEARFAKYGNNQDLKEWLNGQDIVFSNCEINSNLPEPLKENSPEWLRQDRDYQIAAANFYKSDFAAAREKFEKIAADESSVWKNTAKFVAVRTMIRQASFIEGAGDEESQKQAEKDKTELLQKATEKLKNILADNSMSEFHQSAYRLLGLIKYRMFPADRQDELAELLVRPSENQNIYNDLTDFSWLLDYVSTSAEEKGRDIDQKEAEKAGQKYDYNYALKLRDIAAEDHADDLTDWLFTYQAADGFNHAFEKWKETGKLQWFVAAIGKTRATTPQIAEILNNADNIKANSAAFATVRFHQIRLLLETGKRSEAKQKVDEVIADNFKNLPLSAQNQFFAQRMSLAENLEEFLKFAQRKPVIFNWDETGREEPANLSDNKFLQAWIDRTMFDEDSVAFFDQKMPLSVLRQAALSPNLPQQLKRYLIIAVWTRAFILGNQKVEREFTPLVLRYVKEFSALFSKYANAANGANREAAALIAVLRYPVIQPDVPVGIGRDDEPPISIDSNRGNWWCSVEGKNEDENEISPTVFPSFLSNDQSLSGERERKQMAALGNSATYLTRRAVEFANRYPGHPQVPEILHLAVRSTRYGCTDENTGKFSKQAFDLLHKWFPNSAWTKETPYWFGQI